MAARQIREPGVSGTTLDHVGVCARDLGPLAAAYEALGFRLTPPAQQAAGGAPLATGNRCAFLRRGYIELLAILQPGLPDNGLGRLLERREGLHILAIGMDDAAANLARLRQAGLDIPGIAPLERPTPEGARARFERLPYPDAPEGRIQLIRHLTPELLWQPQWLDHPNGAVALEEIFVGGGMDSAARLSRLAGLPLEPRPEGGVALRFPDGTCLSLLDAEAMAAALPGLPPEAFGAAPFLAGFAVRTGDGNAAAARLLQGQPVTPLPGSALLVPPGLAGGAALVFRP
jgi:hypothetical protein